MKITKFLKGFGSLAILTIFLAFADVGPTLINLVELAKPGANNTMLETNAAGDVAWTAKNSVYSGGTGITIAADGTITNIAPDQVVAFTESGIADVTGTYPNFNVDATEVDGSVTNEAQTISAAGSTSPTINLTAAGGAGGGTVTLAASGSASLSRVGNTITIDATASGAPSLTRTRYEEEVSSSTTTITVSGFTPDATLTDVYVDGVHMDIGAGEDATLSGNTYTFSSSLVSGQKFLAKHLSIN